MLSAYSKWVYLVLLMVCRSIAYEDYTTSFDNVDFEPVNINSGQQNSNEPPGKASTLSSFRPFEIP